MTQSEKLEALIERTVSKGWIVEGEFKHIRSTLDDELIVTFSYRNRDFVRSATSIIFDHDFARTLFGNGIGGSYYKLNDPKRTERKLWEHMLQQAVIADSPIDYMYKEVFEK